MSVETDNSEFVGYFQDAAAAGGFYAGKRDKHAGSLTRQALDKMAAKLGIKLVKTGNFGSRLYQHALEDLGVREIPGPSVHPRIAKAFSFCPSWLKPSDDETAWCGVMMGLWTDELGLPRPAEHYRAINWLNVGEPVNIQQATRGDIVVLSRTGGNHVGLYSAHDAATITLLGGNQSNSVNLTKFSLATLKGIRRL